MLLPDLAKEIEETLVFNTSSTRSLIDLRSESNRFETHCVKPVFGLRDASSIYQIMIGSIYSKKASQSSVKPANDVTTKTIQLLEVDSSKTAIITTGLGDK